jgi:integrative and conjugative element protein (TIGR02256 family)
MIEVNIQNTQIIITSTVVDIFLKFRQFNKNEGEKGGIVLGQVNATNDKVLVCRATAPTHADISERTSFQRNRTTAQQIIEYEFYNSNRKNTYLGEWHTHPARFANPSTQDLNMIKQQLKDNDIKVKFVLIFIVAHEEIFVGLHNSHSLNSITIPIKE